MEGEQSDRGVDRLVEHLVRIAGERQHPMADSVVGRPPDEDGSGVVPTLGLRAPDARGGDADVGVEEPSRALGELLGALGRARVGSRREAEQALFDIGEVGDDAAGEPVARVVARADRARQPPRGQRLDDADAQPALSGDLAQTIQRRLLRRHFSSAESACVGASDSMFASSE